MMVSCICPTHGRVPAYQYLLEETIESFQRQDWDEKELIILDDTAGQELVCDAPGVTIIQWPTPVESLGEKYNLAIKASTGEMICPWEDDDISLPWRISKSIELIGDAEYLNPRMHWFLDGGGLHHEHPMGVCHNASMFRRTAWERVGGYPEISGPQDARMDVTLRTESNTVTTPDLPIAEWFFIYRWGVSPVHLSSRRDTESFYLEIRDAQSEPGRFDLRPHYREDYERLCDEHRRRVEASAAEE